MCGITGIMNLGGEPASPALLRKMTGALAHRGPDGEGFFVDGCAGLGHRRLAIIDLSPAGHQPMITRDARYVLSYNGEVYNFQELRLELESRGHAFHSRSDSEVVLHSLVEWGVDALGRFNGMFALAFYDREKRTLILARDRYGVKPLYYVRLGDSFLFGSEIKALLAHPACPTELDLEALVEYFTFQNFFTDRTLFKGVRILPAGTWLELREGAPSVPSPARWWDFCFEEPQGPRPDGWYLERLDELFQQAVSRQLVSDVEIGSYLSGGMDSGSITAVAAQQVENLKTFTVGFDMHSVSGLELAYDERRRAEFMSYLFRTEHYEMVLKAGDMERALPRMAFHLEEPRVGQSYPNYYAAYLAGKLGRVVLSGAGGDEMFAGYPWRYYRAVVNDDFKHYTDKYYRFWQRLLDEKSLRHVFSPVWSSVSHVSTRDIFGSVFSRPPHHLSRPEDYINQSLYFEARTFLHGLLVIEDKLSMAQGLETRVPFLDNDLVDFAMTVPVRLKLGKMAEVVKLNENEPGPKTSRYFQKTRDGKLILRKAMRRHVPREVTQRVKQGFTAPDATWFRGESLDYVRRVLFDKKARLYEFLDRKAVSSLVDDHLEGRHNRRLLIWSLLSFESWCRTFLDGAR